MKISIIRSGGFAGLAETLGSLDTTSLAPAQARKIEALVAAAGFFELPDELTGDIAGADFMRYEVTVSDGTRRHTVRFVDDQSARSHPLAALVEWMLHTVPAI
jgi:hypothetical protein